MASFGRDNGGLVIAETPLTDCTAALSAGIALILSACGWPRNNSRPRRRAAHPNGRLTHPNGNPTHPHCQFHTLYQSLKQP